MSIEDHDMADTARRKTPARKQAAAHPVEAMREQATALEAAMAVALADTAKQPVHRLRVQTRRLEAQVMLLTQAAILPEGSDVAKTLLRQLRKLRRAAGKVRDLDVQEDLLAGQPELPPEAVAELTEELRHSRRRKAARLQALMVEQVPRVAGALEQLVQSIATANGLVVPEMQLVQMIEQWKARRDQTMTTPPEQMDDDQLHDVRKAAKAARYMAESAKDSPEAKKAAALYETQQNAGGVWHDWMDLAGSAKKFFGKKHELTLAAKAKRDAAKAEYLTLLK